MKLQITLLIIALISLTACGNGGLSAASSAGVNEGSSNQGSGSGGTVIGETPPAGSDGCYGMDANTCLVFKATNTQRVANGLAALAYCQACTQMAYEQSKDMSDRGYFDHTRPDEAFYSRCTRFGLASGCGENIAQGYSASQVVQGWMESPGHRANILNQSYRSFGVGLYSGFSTQVFYTGTNR
ncbi:CAP domain-containing protein [Bdellovibrio sp. GT3]|uniref:CAP domain-containing protein n=1 Tax=Bdellovibrio sp. GT3 TaxID=3136282 RepID=UPI0030F173A9